MYSVGHLAPIVEEGPGDFVAEVGQFSGRPALVDVHAVEDLEALLIPPQNLRTVMIAEPELGDRIMRALILRRVVLIEAGAGGPVLIGPEDSSDVVRLQGFLTRNAYPHQVLDPAVDRDAADLVEKYAPKPMDPANSRVVAFGTGPLRSRRGSADARRSRWSARATRLARPPCFYATTPRKSGFWCADQASPKACRNISSIGSMQHPISKY
jgi:hypothetical protein